MAEPAETSAVERRRAHFDNRTRFFLARWDEVRRLALGGDSAGAERICQEPLQHPELGTNFFLASWENTDNLGIAIRASAHLYLAKWRL